MKKREKLEQELAKATAKLERYRHRGQRSEDRIRYYRQGERQKRTKLFPVLEELNIAYVAFSPFRMLFTGSINRRS